MASWARRSAHRLPCEPANCRLHLPLHGDANVALPRRERRHDVTIAAGTTDKQIMPKGIRRIRATFHELKAVSALSADFTELLLALMNIYGSDARTGVSRVGLGRGCTLMQWFMLFGLRASWTSSIIVIHRRKWAARGGAGARGAPRAVLSREPTLSPPTRESRDARRLRLTHSFAVRVCVCPPRARYRSLLIRVQCPPHLVQLGACGPAPPETSHPWPLSVTPTTRAPQLTAQLIAGATIAYERTVSAIDRCMHALDFGWRIYFELLAKWLPMDGHARVDHPTATLACDGFNFADLRRCYECKWLCW